MRQRRLSVAIIGLLLIAGGCGGSRTEPAPRNDTDRLVREFMLVALGAELDQRVEPRVRKWRVPIRIAMPAGTPARLHAALAAHASHLAEVTGHDIRLSAAAEANLMVATPPRHEVPALIETWTASSRGIGRDLSRANCFFLIRSNRDSEIILSHVVVPADLDHQKAVHCVIEEVTQALGLINDAGSLNNSIFNDSNNHINISDKDELFLRILYSPEIKSGMDAAEIQAVLAPCVDRDALRDPATWQAVGRRLPCR